MEIVECLFIFLSIITVVHSKEVNLTCPDSPMDNDTFPLTAGNLVKDGYYFAARINSQDSNFIDIKLSGKAGGWVAIGFSTTRAMSANDIFGCKRDPTDDTVNAIDTWNPVQHYAPNVLDDNQIGMCSHYTEYVNGIIHCMFSRYIPVVNEGQDLDLNQTLYRIYSALSDRGGPRLEHLHKHSETPMITETASNILADIQSGQTDQLSSWPEESLLKFHGCLMIISWILLATSGAFFASWMKPVLPNGEWFQVHRGLMIGSLFVGALGFMVAFVAHAKGTATPGLIEFFGINVAHFAIGIVVMFLHIINPIIALLRCLPDSKWCWIFNLLHGHTVGYSAIVLALINIGIGIHLLQKDLLICYIVIIVFVSLFQFVLFIVFTVNAFTSPEGNKVSLVHSLLRYWYYIRKYDMLKEGLLNSPIAKKEEHIQLTDSSESTEIGAATKEPPIKGALTRLSWSAFGIQMTVTLLTVVFFTTFIATK